jgi:hypothetical protein
MSKAEAMKMILDLAEGNILDERDVTGDPDLRAERDRQCEAFDIAAKEIYELFGDDPAFNA